MVLCSRGNAPAGAAVIVACIFAVLVVLNVEPEQSTQTQLALTCHSPSHWKKKNKFDSSCLTSTNRPAVRARER
jgi:hypothetical protein